MIDINELPAIVGPYVEAVKDAGDKKPVSYTPRYNWSVEQAEEIRIHALGKFPDNLIRAKAPSESEEEFEYRKESYQPVTKAPWARLNNAVESIWHGVNVTTEDDGLASYLVDEYPNYTGLVEWFKEVASPTKAEDPNAVVYVTLLGMPETDADLVSPVAKLLHSKDVVDLTPTYFLGVASRKVPVEYGNRTVNEGLEFVILDDTFEYRYTQVGKKVDWTFELTYQYRHDLGRIPAYQLKGIPRDKYGEIVWESLFYNAIPYLNKAACEASTLDGVIYRHGFPTRVYYEEDCDEPLCDQGYIADEEGSRHICQTCRGTGKKRTFTWGADYTHRPPDRFSGAEGAAQADFPGLTYVAPPIEPMTFLDQRVDALIEKAGHAVNFDLTRKSSQPVTATEKGIDLQEQYKVLFKFSEAIYDVLDYVVDDIARLRFPRAQIEYTINRRADFNIRSAEMLIEEYEKYQSSGLPQFMGAAIIRSQAKMRFNSDRRNMRILEILEYVDGFHGYAPDAVNLALARSGQPWQGVLHYQAYSLILQAEAEDPSFLDRELPEIKTALETRARALSGTGGGAQQIIEGL
jgi:hypothetical protein